MVVKNFPSTSVCLLSPSGRSAVAVIVVAGPHATAVVDTQFYPATLGQRSTQDKTAGGRSLENREVGRIFWGRWGGPRGEEVVVCRRPVSSHGGAWHEGASYVEVHCHGGRLAAQRILDSLVAQGCSLLSWQAWVRRQADDPLQAEARVALAAAPTERTAAILLEQAQGALSRELLALNKEVLAFLGGSRGQEDGVIRRIETLLARGAFGEHLTRPWRVLLAGRPNVGKSSLINALLGFERAIVFDQPGTTRDILSATTAMQGWPVRLSDTAGMHETADPLELQGIRLARAQLSRSDLLVWVLDASRLENVGLADSHEEACCWAQRELACVSQDLPIDLPVLVVLNKVDLAGRVGAARRETRVARNDEARRREIVVAGPLRTSATSGEGIESLVTEIVACLAPRPPASGDAVPFNDRQQRLLRRIRDELQQANFRQAKSALDELLGKREQ